MIEKVEVIRKSMRWATSVFNTSKARQDAMVVLSNHRENFGSGSLEQLAIDHKRRL